MGGGPLSLAGGVAMGTQCPPSPMAAVAAAAQSSTEQQQRLLHVMRCLGDGASFAALEASCRDARAAGALLRAEVVVATPLVNDVLLEVDSAVERAEVLGSADDPDVIAGFIASNASAADGTAATATNGFGGVERAPDEAIVGQLVDMGFPRNGCLRAVLATHNTGVEQAMNWVLAHMEVCNGM